MKKAIIGLVIMLCLPVSTTLAGTGGGDVSALSVVIDIMLLFAGILCFTLCWKIFTLLKGGELSSGWQMLSISFLIFALGQFLSLSIELDFIALHKNAASVLHILALFLIVLGVARIKKSLT